MAKSNGFRHAVLGLGRKLLFSLGAAALTMAAGQPAAQAEDNYPNKPITIILPYTAGAPNDVIMRRVSVAVAAALKGTIVVENRAGSSGVLGAAEVARSKPDGYTLLGTIPDPLIGSTVMMQDVPYNSLEDFTFVTKLTRNFPILIASSSLNVKTVKELVELGRTKTIKYGSYGPGSFPQIWMEDLSRAAGIKMQEVPYRAAPETLQALSTGEVDVTFSSRAQIDELSQQGKAVALAVPGEGPSMFPGIPTYKEAGFETPILTTPIWNGILGPKGLPQEVVDKLLVAIREAFATEEIKKFYAAFGAELVTSSPAEFEADFRREYEAVTPLLRELAGKK